MCGIVGVAGDVRESDRETVRKMCARIRHRGPDDEGFYDSEHVALGMRRLSIIDVAGGAQPVFDEAHETAAVFNGEIYNFRQLQTELRTRGHRLRSESDSECLPHLYEDDGTHMLSRLRGMFGLAIWDRKHSSLFLARDRAGKKPLYYWQEGGRLWFASELKSLFEIPHFERKIDPQAVNHYLSLQYVPAPWSIIRGVRKLPAAHHLVFRGGHAEVTRYWEPQFFDATAASAEPNEDELCEQLRELILEATRIRMVSERPLGAFLSGGLDSSAVVAAMAQQQSSQVSTYSIGFEEDAYNELAYARQVAELYGTDHHELIVKPDVAGILPSIARMFDEPFADPSAVPSFYVAEMASRDLVVVLTGDGGDESFGGYGRYAKYLKMGREFHLPKSLAALGRFGGAQLRRHPTRSRLLNRAGHLAIRASVAHPADRYGRQMSWFMPEEKQALYSRQFRKDVGNSDTYELFRSEWIKQRHTDTANKLMACDIATYLPQDLLPKVDITTMAVSLEARSPLLDQRVVEWATALPGSLKIRDGETKYLLKKAMQPWLPNDLIYRPKMGFGIPHELWLRTSLKPMVHDLLLGADSHTSTYLNREQVKRWIERNEVHHDGGSHVWALLMLELWHREVLQPSS